MSAFLEIVKELTGEVSFRDAATKFNIAQLQEDAALFLNTEKRGGIWIVDKNGIEINIQTENILQTILLPAAAVSFSGDSRALYELLETSFFYNLVNPTSGGGGGGFDVGNWNFITQKSDLPTPVSGVITLPADQTWVIAGDIDLTGDRLDLAGITTIIGGSSETSYITSTGLTAGTALLTTTWTLAMQFVTFRDVDTLFDIDGSINPPLALDWTGVNFLNVPNVGIVNTCDNFVYTKGAFLNSKEFVFDGTHGTIAFNNSLLQGDGAAGDIVRIPATAVITRRFRIIYSSVIAFGSTNGININAATTIPDEGFILDTVNFGGGSTYLPGIGTTSNKALFIRCVGITNTAVNGQMYMQNNATATVVSVVNTFYKALGTTTPSPDNSKYLHSNNRLTNDATIARDYLIQCNLSFTSGNNNVCEFGFFDSKLGGIRVPSRTKSTANAAGRAENISFFCVVSHSQGDYIEIHVANTSATNNITVTDMNVVITEIR